MADALTYVESLFPWLRELNITHLLRQWSILGLEPQAIVAEVRRTDQWKSRFPGVLSPDGSMRMNEADYLSREQDYRTILRQFNRDQEYDNPADFKSFFGQELDPNEVRQRMVTYHEVVRGSDDVRSAFYVYAGMRPNDDELYLAAVNPSDRATLIDEYNRRVTTQPLDYETWITRATEAGLARALSVLTELQGSGVVTSEALARLRAIDPNFAKRMMDSLFHGGSPDGPFLSLDQLLHSFDIALVGGAAVASGLQLPTAERAGAIRQAGIDRARALQGFSEIARQATSVEGAIQRANLGVSFTQEDFERALFLQTAPEVALLERAQASERATGEAGGAPATGLNQRSNLLAQPGLRPQ